MFPILVEWVPKVDVHTRTSIYSRFCSPAAVQYVDELIAWARAETYGLAREILTQKLSQVARPSNCERIWLAMRELAPTGSDPILLAKLSTFPKVAVLVAQSVRSRLSAFETRIHNGEPIKTFGLGYLREYAKVHNPEVQAWFQQFEYSPDPDLRRLVARVAAKKSILPKDWLSHSQVPEDAIEIFSTEVEVGQFRPTLTSVLKTHGIKLSTKFKVDRILEALPQDTWLACQTGQPNMELWLRWEDEDLVHVVLYERAERKIIPQ